MIEVWLNQRSSLNHRWLQNEYSTFLYRIALGDIVTEEWIVRLEEWKRKRDDLTVFVDSTELAFSPRQLLEVFPLSDLPESHKEWLGPLIHEHYCYRTGIRKDIEQLREKLCEVDRVSEKFQTGKPQADTGKKMFQACFELSEMISALPKEIQI